MNIQFVPLDLCEISLEIGNGGMKASNRLRSVICDFTAGFLGEEFLVALESVGLSCWFRD